MATPSQQEPKPYNITVRENGRARTVAQISASQVSEFRSHMLENGGIADKNEWREHRNNSAISLLRAAEWTLEGEIAALKTAKDALAKERGNENAAIARIELRLRDCENAIGSLESGIRKKMRTFDDASAALMRCEEGRSHLEEMSKAIEERIFVDFGLMFNIFRESPAYFCRNIGNDDKSGKTPGEVVMGNTREEWVMLWKLQSGILTPPVIELCRGKLRQYEEDALQGVRMSIEHIKDDEEYNLLVKLVDNIKKLEKRFGRSQGQKLGGNGLQTKETAAAIKNETAERLAKMKYELDILERFGQIIHEEKAAAEKQLDAVDWFMKNCGKMDGLLSENKELRRELEERRVDLGFDAQVAQIEKMEADTAAKLRAVRLERIRLCGIAGEKVEKRRMHALKSPKEDLRKEAADASEVEIFANSKPKAEPRMATMEEKLAAFWETAKNLRLMKSFLEDHPELQKKAEGVFCNLAKMYVEHEGSLSYRMINAKYPVLSRSEKGTKDGHMLVRIGLEKSCTLRLIFDIEDPGKPVLLFAGRKDDSEEFMKNDTYVSAKQKAIDNGEAELFKLLL